MRSVLYNMSIHKLDVVLTEFFDQCENISIADLESLKLDPNAHSIFYAPDIYTQSKLKEVMGDKEECYLASPNVSYVSERFFRFESWHITLLKN